MRFSNVDLLYQEWQWLVRESASAMHAARISGLSDIEARLEERRYALRIDAVYARLKQAEAQSAASLAMSRSQEHASGFERPPFNGLC